VGKRILFTFGILIALFLVYSAYWFYISQSVNLEIVKFKEQGSKNGTQLTSGDFSIAGFPYRLTVTGRDIELRGQRGRLDWKWSTPMVTATAHPWQLSHWVALLGSSSEVEFSSGNQSVLRIRSAGGRMSLKITANGQPARVSFDLKKINARADQFLQFLEIAKVEVHLRQLDDYGSMEAAILIEDILLGDDGNPDYRDMVDGVVAELRIQEALPMGWGKPSLAVWRDSGGIVDLQNFRLLWGPIDLHLDGTFSLDEAFRPIGAANAKISGYRALLELLFSTGMISEGVKIASGLGLDLLATPSQDNSEYVLKAPLTVQDGYLSIGQIPIITVAPVIFN